MTNEQLAYLAAIIDGEGTITINWYREDGRIRYTPRLIVTNTCRPLLEFLQGISGGIGYVGSSKPAKEHWNRCWRWTVTSGQCATMCCKLHPWLVIKRRQAELIMAFRTRAPGRRGKGRDDSAILDEQKRLFTEMAALNARGKASSRVKVDIPDDHPLRRHAI